MLIGSILKCYDFPGNTDCYMIGELVKVDGDLLVCKPIRTVFAGEVKKNSVTEFRCPKQGLAFGDSSFERVVVVG